MSVFQEKNSQKIVRKISVSCFFLTPLDELTIDLFSDEIERKRRLSEALDKINDRYGEYIITPALMMNMDKTIIDRIAFGGLR